MALSMTAPRAMARMVSVKANAAAGNFAAFLSIFVFAIFIGSHLSLRSSLSGLPAHGQIAGRTGAGGAGLDSRAARRSWPGHTQPGAIRGLAAGRLAGQRERYAGGRSWAGQNLVGTRALGGDPGFFPSHPVHAQATAR